MEASWQDSAFGLELTALEEGDTPLEAIVLLKVLDADGHTQFIQRVTKGLGRFEALGMMEAAADRIKAELRDDWEEA